MISRSLFINTIGLSKRANNFIASVMAFKNGDNDGKTTSSVKEREVLRIFLSTENLNTLFQPRDDTKHLRNDWLVCVLLSLNAYGSLAIGAIFCSLVSLGV